MYENFNEFIKNNEKLDIKSEREFLEVYNGKSFLNGLYRISASNGKNNGFWL